MSCDCFVSLSFPVEDRNGIMQYAAKEALLKLTEDSDKAARRILEYFSEVEGNGFCDASKGGGASCCFIGNYVDDKQLIKDLIPFFQRLWPYMSGFREINKLGMSGGLNTMNYFNSAILLIQHHYQDKANEYQISFPGIFIEKCGDLDVGTV